MTKRKVKNMPRNQQKAVMSKISYNKVKNGKIYKISKPKSIDKLLDQGYVVNRVEEKNNKTTIKTYSPLTREEYYKKSKKIK